MSRLALFVIFTTICFTLPHAALHNDALAPPSSTPYLFIQFVTPSFRRVATITTNTNTSTRRQDENDEKRPSSRREVVVVILDKFGLCWRGDLLGLVEDPFLHDDDEDERAPVNHIPYLNYGSVKCSFSILS